ncbi:hypothetical protein R6Q59_020918 [Mikania micrantha]
MLYFSNFTTHIPPYKALDYVLHGVRGVGHALVAFLPNYTRREGGVRVGGVSPFTPRYKQPEQPEPISNVFKLVRTTTVFNQNPSAFDNVSETQQEPDVEVVPETQPDPQPVTSRRSHRRKEVPEKTSKPTITRCSKVEKVALARAYIDISEDPFVGNKRTRNFENVLEPSVFQQCVMTPTGRKT